MGMYDRSRSAQGDLAGRMLVLALVLASVIGVVALVTITLVPVVSGLMHGNCVPAVRVVAIVTVATLLAYACSQVEKSRR